MKILLLLLNIIWANNLGQAAYLKKDWQSCENELNKANNSPNELYIKSICQQKQTKFSDALATIDSLLIKIEPEENLFYKALLLRSWITFKNGDTTLALKQFASAEIYEDPREKAQKLHICHDLYKTQPQSANKSKCLAEYKSFFPNKSLNELNASATSPKNKTSLETKNSGKFFIQLGAFSNENNAKKLAKKFNTTKHLCISNPRQIGDKTLHLVQILQFNSKASAKKFADTFLKPKSQDFRIYEN